MTFKSCSRSSAMATLNRSPQSF